MFELVPLELGLQVVEPVALEAVEVETAPVQLGIAEVVALVAVFVALAEFAQGFALEALLEEQA